MEFAGSTLKMEAYEIAQVDYEETSTDYVKWQGSQTACLALNQLIKSSANEPVAEEESSTPRGWQRQASFDQIPGFSRLSTHDSFDFSPQASSSSAKPLRPSLSRLRSSTAGSRPQAGPPNATDLDLAIPLLGKATPSLFMDMIKGVSARLDESVGVIPGKVQPIRPSKRARHSSLGSTSDLPPGKVKRGRLSAPNELEAHTIRALDKGKGRCSGSPETDPPLSAMSTDVPPTSDERLSNNAVTKGSDTLLQPQSNLRLSSLRTASQTKMPPPALPNKHLGQATPSSRIHPSPLTASSSTTSATSSAFHTSSSHSVSRHHTTAIDSKPPKSEPTPKLHPLLVSQQAKPASLPQVSKAPAPSRGPSRILPTTSTYTKPPPPAAPKPFPSSSQKTRPQDCALPSSTPKLSSSQSVRPPALGMRRTNITPGVLQPGGALPTKRKGFKPPLLSASQTPLSQAAPSSPPARTDARSVRNAAPVCSSGSTSSESLRASTSSASSASPPSPSPTAAPRAAAITTAASVRRAADPPPASQPLPEPLDGDGDSSFGDMSFDMDALEETMRQYD